MNSSKKSHTNELNMDYYSLGQLCDKLGISYATGLNWVRLEKITPAFFGKKKEAFFEKKYVENLIRDIKRDKNTALKSRRNKRYVYGSNIYKSYIDENSPNKDIVEKILDAVSESHGDRDISSLAPSIIYHYACRLIELNHLPNAVAKPLLSDLEVALKKNFKCKTIDYDVKGSGFPDINYVESEDTLGYIYISLNNLRSRKSTGAYYTPNRIVKKLLETLDTKGKKILDPCCGCGNFLLKLPADTPVSSIYACDIDSVAIAITHINLALRFDLRNLEDYELLCKNIVRQNFLNISPKESFDCIIGNPPWGYAFSSKQIQDYSKKFECCNSSSHESYDLFIEKAIKLASQNAIISFVLPEAILGVKGHSNIRKYILEHASIHRLLYLGDVFDKVQCPSVILELQRNRPNRILVELENGKAFDIAPDRAFSSSNFNILSSDEEYEKIKQIDKLPGTFTLKDNADFALGIVSGNNKGLLFNEKKPGAEPIIRGSSISAFDPGEIQEYTFYNPESFQQIAPEKMYHTKEKLLYKFIASYPIVARDTKGCLTLNSCNIIIPRLEGISAEYIMAVLNSRVVKFYYTHTWKTLKVLRAHLESIPIPDPGPRQDVIIELVHKIESSSKEERPQLIDSLNQIIEALYNISLS